MSEQNENPTVRTFSAKRANEVLDRFEASLDTFEPTLAILRSRAEAAGMSVEDYVTMLCGSCLGKDQAMAKA